MGREMLSSRGPVRVRTISIDPVTDRKAVTLLRKLRAANFSEFVRRLIADRFDQEFKDQKAKEPK